MGTRSPLMHIESLLMFYSTAYSSMILFFTPCRNKPMEPPLPPFVPPESMRMDDKVISLL